MSRLSDYVSWEHLVVGIVAIALTAIFTIWYGSNHHPVHTVPMQVEAGQ